MSELAAYLGLFAVAFGAATLLPLQSEGVLVGMLAAETWPAWTLVAVASLGNTAGSALNWGLGRGIEQFHAKRWFPVGRDRLARAQSWYLRYGRWSLLMSWLPIVGDAITLAAGVLGERFGIFLLLVGCAKTARYMIVAAATMGWIG